MHPCYSAIHLILFSDAVVDCSVPAFVYVQVMIALSISNNSVTRPSQALCSSYDSIHSYMQLNSMIAVVDGPLVYTTELAHQAQELFASLQLPSGCFIRFLFFHFFLFLSRMQTTEM